jgi:hypothetical protein
MCRPLLWGILLCLAASGCAARQVVRNPDHGVVAIPSNADYWPFKYRQKAETLMAEHFPDGYAIEHEEETIVGQTVSTDSNAQPGVTRTTTTASDNTEWRIYYRRR